MLMDITIQVDTSEPAELTALMALCASLGGRLPAQSGKTVTDELVVKLTADTSELTAAIADAKASAGSMEAPTDTRPTGSSSNGEASSLTGSSTPDRDSQGLPWDERIHSSSRAINADGSWRQKRGVSELIVGKVTAELQAAASDDTPPPPAEPVDDTPPPPSATGGNEPAATASEAPAATTAPSGMAGYQAFMSRVSRDMKAKGLTYVKLDEHAREIGLAKFTELSKNLDMVPMLAAHLEALGLLTPVDGE
jgi:hypothetical protein